ncbi:MAG: signal peptidase II [Pseudomonadota bacterium]|nr:signal peptidase II [Pseudomonadota bacterium]
MLKHNTLSLENLLKSACTVMALVISDQITKHVALEYLTPGAPSQVFPGLTLYLVSNSGIAFSLLSGYGKPMEYILALACSAILLSLCTLLSQEDINQKTSIHRWALRFILAGGMGNLIDRLCYGAVIDFIYLHYNAWAWPAIFNIADVWVCIGCGMLILSNIAPSIGLYRQQPLDQN